MRKIKLAIYLLITVFIAYAILERIGIWDRVLEDLGWTQVAGHDQLAEIIGTSSLQYDPNTIETQDHMQTNSELWLACNSVGDCGQE